MPGENVMKLGEQWEIEMPGFGKMTVGSQTNTNKQTNRQADTWSALKQIRTKNRQTNGQSSKKCKQMVSSETNTNLGKPKKAIPRLT